MLAAPPTVQFALLVQPIQAMQQPPSTGYCDGFNTEWDVLERLNTLKRSSPGALLRPEGRSAKGVALKKAYNYGFQRKIS